MMTLISCYLVPLLIAALIGLLTGWWAWANRVRVSLATAAPVSPTLARVSVPEPAPVRVPEPIRVPEPVKLAEPVAVAPVAAAPPPPAAPKVVAKTAPAKPAPKPAPAKAAPKSAAAPKAAPVAVAAALTAIGIPAALGVANNLLQLKGVGPKLNTLLNGLGVTRFDQIAAWGAKEIGIVDGHLGSFKGRIGRDEWVEQAGYLASGNIAAFEAKFGKLDSENK